MFLDINSSANERVCDKGYHGRGKPRNRKGNSWTYRKGIGYARRYWTKGFNDRAMESLEIRLVRGRAATHEEQKELQATMGRDVQMRKGVKRYGLRGIRGKNVESLKFW